MSRTGSGIEEGPGAAVTAASGDAVGVVDTAVLADLSRHGEHLAVLVARRDPSAAAQGARDTRRSNSPSR
ncbi:hypothetical protein [Streptomyces sp. MBT62]|uniref:hypothetical protein n=1 Tax=Streptomyces sp. MBT62 TaxID=2800410 RepID=UPI001909279B|nr:hypothetical protein [Streptomyces sp. MBT62]MBK3565753.1 hypothetical protein [Streptomyces sp. MBT62]